MKSILQAEADSGKLATTRRARIEAIRSGGLVRQALGQAATYRRLDDGRHEVSIRGQTTVAPTLDQAIDQARTQTDGAGGPSR